MSKEAMKLALEALQASEYQLMQIGQRGNGLHTQVCDGIKALEEALAKQEQCEHLKKLKVTLEDRTIDIELIRYKKMFETACFVLGAVSHALGCDPEERGAEKLLSAIAELKTSKQEQGEPDLDAICQDLQEKTYTQAMRIAELEEALAQSQSDVKQEPKPFGYTLEETMKCWDLGYAAAVKALAKQEQPYADKAASVSNDRIKIDPVTGNVQIGTAKQEQSAEHVGDPVAVKHMMEWVTFLKARSDNGQHKQIPSNLSAGACWDLAVELEQFINTHPQPKREPLTDEQIEEIADGYLVDYRIPAGCAWNFARDIEAAHGIKE